MHVLSNIKNQFNSKNRTAVLKINLFTSVFFKMSNVLMNFLIVPLTINYLNPERYGIWLVISSIVGWASIFDLGLGNGLKNKLNEKMSKNESLQMRQYISTTYAWLIIITGLLFLGYLLLIQLFPLTALIHSKSVSPKEIELVLTLTLFFFCLRLIFSIVNSILSAMQLTAFVDIINFFANLFSLVGIYFLMKFSESSLIGISVVFSAVPIIIFALVSVILFSGKLKDFSPRWSSINLKAGKEIMSMGWQFFVIQIAGIIIFSTDNIIISQNISAEEVTVYNIAFKLFGIVTMFFAILSTPLWPAYSNAFHTDDVDWIKKTTKKLVKIWLLFVGFTILLLCFSNPIYTFWIGEKISIPFHLSLAMAIYVCMLAWGSIYVTFINSVGKIRLQLIFSIGACLLNIPLSIFFINYLNLGSTGVILATCICLSYGPFVAFIQYRKIINKTAIGIWNK